MQDRSLEYGVSVILEAFKKIFKGFALILISRPSTGKGKLSMFLESIGFHIISSSSALTEMAESEPDNPVMLELLHKMQNGDFIERDLVVMAIQRKLSVTTGFSAIVFDGFPREDDQAYVMKDILDQRNIPCMTLELHCIRDEANNRRLQRIHEANQAGNPPRSEDLNINDWNKRQDQYEERYKSLSTVLAEFSHYVKLDTTRGSRKQNHTRALAEILRFASSLKV
jgi:adenylate kinase family enzyme